MGARLETPQFFNNERWLVGIQFTTAVNTSVNPTAGRVFLNQFEVKTQTIIEALLIRNEATVLGNVIVGIYGPIVSDDTCAGAPLVAQSASTALSGASQMQTINLSADLSKGTYYFAVEYDNASHTYGRTSNNIFFPAVMQYYDRGGGYGALVDPCPAVTNNAGSSATTPPNMLARCTI